MHFSVTLSKEISSNASIIITFFSIVSILFVCPILNCISAFKTFAPIELRSHVPHVVSARTNAGIPNFLPTLRAKSCTLCNNPSGPFSATEVGLRFSIISNIFFSSITIISNLPNYLFLI